MDELANKSNLDINFLLINWGLLSGHLHDGIIQPTGFGRFNQWFTFFSCLFTAIKWLILLLTPKESETIHLLGDWTTAFGPKIILDSIIIFLACYIITVKLTFIFASYHSKKMLYWLDTLKYDQDTKSFNKLNLNEAESKMFIRRFSLSIFLLRCVSHVFMISFYLANFVFVLMYRKGYYLNYLISLVIFIPQHYIDGEFIFGFLAILYPVGGCNFK